MLGALAHSDALRVGAPFNNRLRSVKGADSVLIETLVVEGSLHFVEVRVNRIRHALRRTLAPTLRRSCLLER